MWMWTDVRHNRMVTMAVRTNLREIESEGGQIERERGAVNRQTQTPTFFSTHTHRHRESQSIELPACGTFSRKDTFIHVLVSVTIDQPLKE